MFTHRLLNIAVLLLAFGGCNQGPEEPSRYPVRGTVLIDGKPLPDGLIYFKTTATGAVDSAPIKEGKFEGQAEAGKRRIEITSPQTIDNPNATPGMLDKEQRETIPARYNSQSELTEEVKTEGVNEFSFTLESK